MAEPKPPGRRLSVVALRPGISVFLRPRSYMDTVHEANYRELRMYDVGPHCLFQALDDKGEVKEQAEVLWHSIWWRRVAA